MDFIRFLRRELAPFPWRINLVLRCVLASAVVILAAMSLEIPALPLALLVVFYTTQSNAVITRLAGIVFLLGASLGLGIFLVLIMFTIDHPLLRIAGAGLVLFVCAWLMRVLKLGTMFYIVAMIVIYLQSQTDSVPVPELLVRLTLWVWAVVSYAIVVALLVNTLLLPIAPERQLKLEIHRQLGAVDAELLRLQEGAARVQPSDAVAALAGMLTLQKLLKFMAMRGQRQPDGEAWQLALIASVSRLGRAARGLPAAPGMPAPPLLDSIRRLRAECAALDAAAQAGVRYRLDAPPPATTNVPGIEDMWRTLDALSAAGPAEGAGAHEDPMVAPDALSNPAYVRFALKALLAVNIGYVFYNAVQWQGIHTLMLTCLIVALPSLGASTQKALLRIGGALAGSALALLAVVFVIPRIDGIVGLLLMALPVIGLGAWLAAGSERISYAGIQVMFTFALAVLESFGPTTRLTEIRDRMVGILLGVVLAAAIQTLVWPEGEGEVLRHRLAALLRSSGVALRGAVGEGAHLAQTRQEVSAWSEFAATQAMLARVALEPGWNEDTDEVVTARAQALLSGAREILRAGAALRGQLAVATPTPPVRAGVDALCASVADALERYAAALEADPPHAGTPALLSPAAFGLSARDGGQDLAAAAQALLRQAGGLPDWGEPAPRSVGAPVRP